MDDLLSDFIAETNESLERLDQDLVKLEQNPNDPDLLGNIFRVMHTVGEEWHVNDDIKSMVRYQSLNLLDPFSILGKFDLILCRNVLIYLDCNDKSDVMDRLVKNTMEDGFLMLGAAETVLGITDEWKPLKSTRGLYVPQAMDTHDMQEKYAETG